VNTLDKGVLWKNRNCGRSTSSAILASLGAQRPKMKDSADTKLRLPITFISTLRTSTQGKKLYQCKVCKSEFVRQDIPTRHVETNEVSICLSSIVCLYYLGEMSECHCGSIVFAANRWTHDMIACRDRITNTEFFCEPCEAKFQTKSAFYRHNEDSYPNVGDNFAEALTKLP
jgi:hypothetical protein